MSLPPPDAMSRWNRRILTVLGLSFLVMSAAVYLDPGASGQTQTLSASASLGKQVWQKQNCMVCHQFYGMGGYLGPDLTNVAGRIGPETIAWVVRNGRGSMPAFDMSEEELAGVVAFLSEMNRTGTFPLRSTPQDWFPEPGPGVEHGESEEAVQ